MAAAHWSLIEEPSFENVMLSILGPTADMAAAAGRGANTAPPSAGRTQAAIPPPQRLGLRPVTPGTPRAPAEAVGQVAEARLAECRARLAECRGWERSRCQELLFKYVGSVWVYLGDQLFGANSGDDPRQKAT